MNDALKVLLIAGGAYLAWNWYNSSAAAVLSTPTSAGSPPTPTNPAATSSVPTTSGTPPPASYPNPIAFPPASNVAPPPPVVVTPAPAAGADAWAQAVQVMKQNAGVSSANWDQWSYWWQNSPTFAGAPFGFGVSGSISGSMFGALLMGAAHDAQTTAEQFVANLRQTVSNLGLGGYRMPRSRRDTGFRYSNGARR